MILNKNNEIGAKVFWIVFCLLFTLLPITLISIDLYNGIGLLDIDLFKYIVPAIKWISEWVSKIVFGILIILWVFGQAFTVIGILLYPLVIAFSFITKKRRNGKREN